MILKGFWTTLADSVSNQTLYLRQIIEVKKLTKFLSQFSLGDYSVRHELEALLFHLGKEKTHESISPCIQSYSNSEKIKKKRTSKKSFVKKCISTCRGWMTWISSVTGSPGSRSLRRVVHMSNSSRQEIRSWSANHKALRNYEIKHTKNLQWIYLLLLSLDGMLVHPRSRSGIFGPGQGSNPDRSIRSTRPPRLTQVTALQQ